MFCYIVSILVWEERAGCFALLVFLVSHDCCVALPRVTQVCLQFVNVVFANHTHLIFFKLKNNNAKPNWNCRSQFRGIPWNQTSDVHRG